jgi:hypothetical protein
LDAIDVVERREQVKIMRGEVIAELLTGMVELRTLKQHMIKGLSGRNANCAERGWNLLPSAVQELVEVMSIEP